MELTSPAFQDKESIPTIYTCEGKNIHPPLLFHNIPANAKTLVLLMDDPDVPASVRPEMMYDHWVLFNIPPHTKGIKEMGEIPGVHGQSTNGKNRYTGPCPPFGEHRYFFKLYALNTHLTLPEGSTKEEVKKGMQGHVLAEATLMGRYAKKKG